MNDELSPAELTRLYDRFKKRGESALKPYSETHLCQLLDFIEDKIQAMLVMQGRFKIANPTYPHDFEPEGLQSNKRALEIVNDLLQNGRPPEPENTSDKQTTFIAHLKGLEAALYFALIHAAGYGETQAWEDVKQFDRLTSGKDLYNNVSKIKKENFNHVKNCTTGERRHWIDRLKNVIPHLHTDGQKKTAVEILQHLEKQNENK